jgi:hypothetical protein
LGYYETLFEYFRPRPYRPALLEGRAPIKNSRRASKVVPSIDPIPSPVSLLPAILTANLSAESITPFSVIWDADRKILSCNFCHLQHHSTHSRARRRRLPAERLAACIHYRLEPSKLSRHNCNEEDGKFLCLSFQSKFLIILVQHPSSDDYYPVQFTLPPLHQIPHDAREPLRLSLARRKLWSITWHWWTLASHRPRPLSQAI